MILSVKNRVIGGEFLLLKRLFVTLLSIKQAAFV